MKIAVTGGNGMLGKDICIQLNEIGDYEIVSLSRSRSKFLNNKSIRQIAVDCTNITDFKQILSNLNPQIVIHNAAIVNLQYCEDNYSEALKTHASVLKTIHEIIPKAKLIYISTDSVHDGLNGNYNENNTPNPLNNYAKSKCEGELLVTQLFDQYIIIRTNIYGFHAPKANSLAEWAIENFNKKNKIQGFSDVIFNPVYTKQLALAISELISLDYQGIINIGCKEFISKYDFLLSLNRLIGVDENLVENNSVDNFSSSIKRPKNTTLNTDLLSCILNKKISFEDGIRELIDDYNNLKNGGN